MRDNVKAFIELANRVFDPPAPVVEIGACQTAGQEGYADLRSLFAGKAYLGCDAAPGPGVDRIEDVHVLTFADDTVGTIVCADTLEHVADPARAVAEMHRVLRPDGLAIVSTPFNFPVHYMPDYVRYTPEGLARLLGRFALQAVFAHGDAQHPHTVNAVARKRGDAAAGAFEDAAARLQARWSADQALDALVRFEPLASVLRCADWSTRPTGAGRVVEQTFVCQRDGLARIDALLGSDGAPRPTRWQLRLRNPAGAELIATGWIPVPGELRWVAFAFPALAGTAGQELRFELEAAGHAAPATAYACDIAAMPTGGLRVDGAPAPGALCFEAFCRRVP